MSTEKPRPSAKQRAAMRRRRTFSALGLLIVIGLLVWLLLWRPWGGGGSTEPEASTSASKSAAETAAPSPTVSPSPSSLFTPIEGGESGAAEASQSPGAEPVCDPAKVALAAVVDKEEYGEGQTVLLSFTIENKGPEACTVNTGTAKLQYEVRSGDESVYRFTDCAVELRDNIAVLEPATPRATEPLPWNQTSSSTETCASERPRLPAGGAKYELRVTVDGIESDSNASFALK